LAPTIDASNQAALQMSSVPATGEQPLFPLWQMGCTGIRLAKFANWKRRRDGAVAYLSGVSY